MEHRITKNIQSLYSKQNQINWFYGWYQKRTTRAYRYIEGISQSVEEIQARSTKEALQAIFAKGVAEFF